MMVLGIRPDVIRASLIIQQLRDALGSRFVFVWSGQHYSRNMKDVFFRQLDVPGPDYELSIETVTEVNFIGQLIPEVSKLLEIEQPSICCFLGDTNTVLGSLACAASNVPIAHIEGCMRSYDWRMPEEKYRTVIDHLSDVIYAYLPNYKQQGLAEGLDSRNIIVTGNPIVDVLEHYFRSGKIRLSPSDLEAFYAEHHLKTKSYVLMTAHRRENVENYEALSQILQLAENTQMSVIFPASYRTQRAIRRLGLTIPANVRTVDPIGYVEFLELLSSSQYVLTDSGTVVEEAAVLGIPSVQMRASTERPEVYECYASVKFDPHSNLAREEHRRLLSKVESYCDTTWTHGLGDGQASSRIVEDLISRVDGLLPTRGHLAAGSGKPYQRNWGTYSD